MTLGYGWLSIRGDIPHTDAWFGLHLKPELETRWEEFTLAHDVLESRPVGRVVDLGAGFEPGVHVMPEIAASLGWRVDAVDLTPIPEGDFPSSPLITRHLMDMTDTPFPDASFDVVLCISVLEHLEPEVQAKAFDEIVRLTRPGGLVCITLDGTWPRLMPGFDWGEAVIPAHEVLLLNNLGWPVTFMVGRKDGPNP